MRGWATVAGTSLLLAACGGGGGSSAWVPVTGTSSSGGSTAGSGNTGTGASTPTATTGFFLDAAVEGLDYQAGSATVAQTDAQGRFQCKPGETVRFRAGALELGSAACGSVVTPLTLAGLANGAVGVQADAVVNRLLALQSLDDDGDPSNGIRLTSELKARLKAGALDFSATAADFNTSLQTLLAGLPAPWAARTVDDSRRLLAREHFENTLAAAVGTPVAFPYTQSNALGTLGVTVTRYQLMADGKYYVPYEGTQAAVRADFPMGFLPAYGSGLAFKGKADDGALEFYAVTDRGPNGDGPTVPVPGDTSGATSVSKVFPAPSFTPSFGLIRVGKGGAVLASSTPLRVDAQTKVTGLPPKAGSVGSTGEIPLTDTYVFDATKSGFDANGLDPESMVYDKARNVLWTSDEYGPFVARVNIATGVIEKKYAPGNGLPAIFAKRRLNRGMEGLTLDVATGRLHGFLQSPIDPKDANGKSLKAKPPGGSNTDVRHIAKFARWVEFDPATETSKSYAYPIDGSAYDKDRTGNAKLGDVVSLGNGRFIVIEQGARKSDGRVMNKLMLVVLPAGATDIAAMDENLEISSITQAASNGANYASVVPMQKTELLDLNALGWLAEKAEGLALVDDNTLALVNDDDFGLSTVLLDANGNKVDGSVEDCTFDASGNIVSGCPTGMVKARITRGSDLERPTRVWFIKLDRALSGLRLPS
ncbi:MAG: esterase-like activity of phytase family protein [Pseudacidovorax sp.]|uniref:esterase-like activity of phytase family protein n=1 Tax=Pseudacidovorax sp. TaxID=1934311 RepID=UPI001B4C9356|nr:esterase-like activity of phytase family protein [Pseudacidovorax sp.]MBP6896316.1 esterase-like activity of phytase family protein [Pseudacidovorax sp.]